MGNRVVAGVRRAEMEGIGGALVHVGVAGERQRRDNVEDVDRGVVGTAAAVVVGDGHVNRVPARLIVSVLMRRFEIPLTLIEGQRRGR